MYELAPPVLYRDSRISAAPVRADRADVEFGTPVAAAGGGGLGGETEGPTGERA